MTNSLTRRAIIKGASATAAALAMPSIAKASPDAELLRLADELETIHKQRTELWAVTLEKMGEAKCKYPPLPETARATEQDLREFGFPQPMEWSKEERRHLLTTHYGTFQRNELAQLSCHRSKTVPVQEWLQQNVGNPDATAIVSAGKVMVLEPNPPALERKREIVAAIDSWKTACNAVDAHTGQDVLSVQYDELESAFSDTLGRFEALEATTPAGLRAKVRAIACIQSEGPIAFDDVTDERLACEVLNAILGSPALLAG